MTSLPLSYQFYSVPTHPYATNTYLLLSKESSSADATAIVIDPGVNSLQLLKRQVPLLDTAQYPKLVIWLTHSHWDHIAGWRDWFVEFGGSEKCSFYLHPEDEENFRVPGSDQLPIPGKISIAPYTGLLNYFHDEEELNFLDSSWKIIHTPGHSLGSICIYDRTHGVLFSGDTVFKGSIGNLSFPKSDAKKMGPSVAKILKLPLETKIYPGHGAPTTLKEEYNFLQRMANSL